ncbi:MAG: hypothetical protein WC807_05000 [Hyphomicrobium sp.]|jgi:hypothetical protein
MASTLRGWAVGRGARIAALVAAVVVAGCAADNGGPTSKSLPSGETCASVKAQLSKLDGRGVPSSVQALAEGKKLSPAQKADADLYNRLLNDYLGARCHVAPQ